MKDMMPLAQIALTSEQMRELARYEFTFKDIIVANEYGDGEVVFPEPYTFQLEDLLYTLQNLQRANPTVYDFGEYWYCPIDSSREDFDLDTAMGYGENVEDTQDTKELCGYPFTDSMMFNEIWDQLEAAWRDHEDEELMGDILDLDAMVYALRIHFENKKNSVDKWVFTSDMKARYIRRFEESSELEMARDDEISMARKFTEELCKEENLFALYLKGYACYGGNRLYECDWEASRDCISKLYEKTEDAQYANTLGYIYYYGRCNGGQPEYEKALPCFELAAAGGFYEGLYKLADMYCHGYGCRQSKKAAGSLYRMVYEDCMKQFLDGRNSNFADAALRMGNVFAEGIGVEVDPTQAYYYYLQASYAAELRAKDSNFFGNKKVLENCRKALAKTREKLEEGYLKEEALQTDFFYLRLLASENYPCEINFEKQGDSLLITASRMPTRSVPKPKLLFVTFPEISYCSRTDKITFRLSKDCQVSVKDHFVFDACEWNHLEQRYDFYKNYEIVNWIRSESYEFVESENRIDDKER